jgi:hypothetical protein
MFASDIKRKRRRQTFNFISLFIQNTKRVKGDLKASMCLLFGPPAALSFYRHVQQRFRFRARFLNLRGRFLSWAQTGLSFGLGLRAWLFSYLVKVRAQPWLYLITTRDRFLKNELRRSSFVQDVKNVLKTTKTTQLSSNAGLRPENKLDHQVYINSVSEVHTQARSSPVASCQIFLDKTYQNR